MREEGEAGAAVLPSGAFRAGEPAARVVAAGGEGKVVGLRKIVGSPKAEERPQEEESSLTIPLHPRQAFLTGLWDAKRFLLSEAVEERRRLNDSFTVAALAG